MRKRTKVSANDAEDYLELIRKRWSTSEMDAFEMYGNPKIVPDWDGHGHFGICWDGPYEWTYYTTIGSLKYEEREPEFGIRLPIVEVPTKLGHVFSEPYNQSVLILYFEG